MREKIVVLSDLHLAPPGPLSCFHADEALAALVLALAREPDAAQTTLLLAGDTLDLLQIPGRAVELSAEDVPELIRSTLEALRRSPSGAFFQALAAFMDRGGECVIIPGNHDLELYHPHARELLLELLGKPSIHPGLVFHDQTGPWRAQVGPWEVIVGHGHRGDAWNDYDPAAIRSAMEAGGTIPLPPGSRLVLEAVNHFKQSPQTGQPWLPFTDLLKPEAPAVPLLLLYLTPWESLRRLRQVPAILRPARYHIVRQLRRLLGKSPTLGPSPVAPPDSGVYETGEAFAQLLAEGLTDRERQSSEPFVTAVENWLQGEPDPGPGYLANHGGVVWRPLCRGILRRLSGQAFFDRHAPSPHDQQIIKAHLEGADAPRVVISGHTHAAREIFPSSERAYLNTGTWCDLIEFPQLEDGQAVRGFIDSLEADHVPRKRILIYAEVIPSGVRLREWS